MQKILTLESIYNDRVELTPLQRLRTCKITKDKKYIVLEGKAYFIRTGQQVPLNEEWTLSDILHTGADLLSAGMDFAIPGSGAIVDVLNALSYVIEAQFKPAEEKDSLYLMAGVTFGFVAIPSLLQPVAIPLKRFLKGGVKVATPAIKKALGFIYKFLDKILGGSLTWIKEAIKSPLAKNIMGKFGNKVFTFFDNFSKRIKTILERLLPASAKTGAAAGKVGIKNVLDKVAKTRLVTFIRSGFKINKGSLLLRKLGFVPGKAYKFTAKNGKVYEATIRKYTDDMVELFYKNPNGKNFVNPIRITEFASQSIGAPFMRRGYSVTVPLFVKRLTDFLDDNGYIDPNKMQQFPDLNPDDTAKETAEFSADYQGDTGQYQVNETVKTFQQALILLNYKMKGNDDGKFGPETMNALTEFQKQNNIPIGKMDRATAKKLAEVLNKQKPRPVGILNYTNVAKTLISL